MLSRFRHIFGAVFFLLIASCSGGGCGGCGGCTGLTPLPGGFPAEKAVENAASVRISRPGLDFVEKELPSVVVKAMKSPDGTFTVQVPETSFAVKDAFLGFDANGKFCPGGPDPKATPPRCTAVIDIAQIKFQVDATKPDVVVVRGLVPLKLDDTPVKLDDPVSLTVHVAYGANSSCDGGTPHVDIRDLPVKISVPIVSETAAPRTGYTRIDVENAVIDLDAISSDDVRICGSCAGLGVCNSILNWGFLKDRIVDALKSGLSSQFKNLIRDQLCTKPNPSLNPSCPTETSPDAENKYCVFDSDKDKCVPLLLGTAAHVELGGFLRNVSPGTAGGLDFGLGAFGPMIPAPGVDTNDEGDTPNGITLGMVGGALAQPPSKCVPQKTILAPSGIPIPDEIAPKAPDPGTTPHVGVAIAGRFLDYSLGSVYNSGLLCLGVSTSQLDLLKSGLLAFLIPSIKTLTFEQNDAAAAITTRPQAPPVVKIGGGTDPTKDPLLTITIPKLSFDFYIWSFDRFARVFTYTGDVTIPVTLQTGKAPNNPNGGILPAIGELKVANGKVSNADTLLFEENDVIAGAVAAVVGTVSKQLLGVGFSPINVSGLLSSYGLNLDVNSIKKLTKGSDDFIGLFATLSKAASTATVEADTQAMLVGKRVWSDHMSASTYAHDKLPELELELSSSLDDGKRAIEYSWWIDGGTRSPWSQEKHLVIKDDQLFLQGRHVLHVSSRIAGDAATEDTTPADVPYVIDALAPFVKIESGGAAATLKAWDLVSEHAALLARYRLDDGELGAWRPVQEIEHLEIGSAASIDVEVKDEEGNVATVRQALRG
ncbi:MAG TPA: hypothetical protein VM925_25900, partial [Labilithrix sp.]|nr:hypothetical protein [Labilithrix sp.]